MIDEIAHIIPTYERPGVCQRLVDSINREFGEDSRIYVCDDSRKPAKYKGAKNIKAPAYDIGLSAKRNFLVQETDEPYIFLWDDDYLAFGETNLEMFYHTLKALDGVGIVAGEWMLDRGKRVQWFDGWPRVEGGTFKLRPIETEPRAVQTEIGEVRYHPLALCTNWFLATREALEACPWDETLKLNEHVEYFCRLSALRNKTDLDKKWRKRYNKLAKGQPLKQAESTEKVAVYTLTTFYDSSLLEDEEDVIHEGTWIDVDPDMAEKLAEKGYAAHLGDIADNRPFYVGESEADLGVALVVDTTCLHLRQSSRNGDYNRGRDRWGQFGPMQNRKLGVKERDMVQWSKYPYDEPTFSYPDEELLEEKEADSWELDT